MSDDHDAGSSPAQTDYVRYRQQLSQWVDQHRRRPSRDPSWPFPRWTWSSGGVTYSLSFDPTVGVPLEVWARIPPDAELVEP